MFKNVDKEKLKKNFKVILTLIIITIFVSIPYFPRETFFAHDIGYHLNRIIQISKEIKIGHIPVLIHPDLLNGLGYANPLFYPELFLYIPAILVNLGLGVLFSYKLFLMIITFCTFLFTYITAKKIFKSEKVGWLVSLMYTMSLYRLVDIYIRGALGEVLAFTFLPLVILGLYEIIFGENKKWWILSLAIFGLINSHILTYAIAVVFIILFGLINIKKLFKDKSRLKNYCLAGIVAILICTNYILPYLEQENNDKFNVDVHINNGNSLYENAASVKEAFKSDLVNTNTYMPTGIGIVLIVLPWFIFKCKNNKEKDEKLFLYELLAFGSIFWILSTRLFPWRSLGFFSVIQFPYRFNIMSTLFFSFVGGYVAYNIFDNKRDMTVLIAILLFIMVGNQLSQVNLNINNFNYDYIISNQPEGNAEYKPVGFSKEPNYVYNYEEKDKKIEYEKTSSKIVFDYDNKDLEMKIHIPLTYYKGYVSYIECENGDKKELNISKDQVNAHIMISSDEKLTGKITVEYKMTNIQKIGYIITYITLIGLLIYIFKSDFSNKKIKNSKENYKVKKGKIISKEKETV